MHKIMIVDDEVVIAAQLKESLTAMGYRVVGSATNGVEAVDQALRLKPDMVFMDVVMPGELDGITAAERIKQHLDVSIIFVTAYSDQNLINRAKDLKPAAYIIKPFQEAQIRVAVEIALRGIELERELRASEEKYRDLVENVNDVIYALSFEGVVTYVSPQVERMLGYTPEELVGAHFSGIVHPDEEEDIRRAFRKILEGRIQVREHRMLTKDGRCRWVRASSRPVGSREGTGVQGVLTDVTERKHMEEQALFRSLVLDQIHDRVTITDLEGRITYVNDAECRMLGQPRERLIGKHVSTYEEVPEDGTSPEEMIRAALKGGGWRGELLGRNAQGGAAYLDARLQVIKDAAGRATALCGIRTDITERKRAEQALQASEQFRGRIIHSLVSGLYIYNLTNRCFDFISPQYTAITGWTLDHINRMEKSFSTLFHPEDRPRVEAHFQHLARAEDGDVLEIEYRFRTREGAWIWCFSRDTVFDRGEQGRVVRFIGSFFDVTERRQAEEELSRIFNLSLDMLCIADIHQATFLKVNPAFTETLGFSTEELLGRSFLELVHPEDVPATVDVIERSLKKGNRVINFENRYRCRDGGYRWLNWVSHPIPEEGVTYGVAHDVTEQRRVNRERLEYEARLKQAQKMEAVGTLAGGIAHDFNNILSIVLGNTELAMMDLPGTSPAVKSLEEVRSASLRARDLVKQILLFARREEHTLARLQAGPIVKESLKMMRASLPATVAISREIEADLPAVRADPSQIQQIVMNLCTNAGQVMESEGGTLRFGLNAVSLDAPLDTVTGRIPEGAYVRLRVSDTGPGIAPEHLERIFDPFFTTKDVGEGTGLGLAVVHGIVQARGGGVTVESEPGRGAAFTVYLPACGPEADPEIESQPEPPRGTGRILLVDDEPSILNLGRQMLERQGYQVVTDESGRDALKRFKQDPGGFDLVITDMTMPGLRGDHLTIELLAVRPDLPVILTTGYSKLISEEKAKELGVRAFVMKPLTAFELAHAVQRALEETAEHA